MRIENEELATLRKLAKFNSKKFNVKHTKALDEIAKAKGYTNWSRLYENLK